MAHSPWPAIILGILVLGIEILEIAHSDNPLATLQTNLGRILLDILLLILIARGALAFWIVITIDLWHLATLIQFSAAVLL